MADTYSPWMASSDEDITDGGLATPEYAEMYAEAQAGSETEAQAPEMEAEGGMHEAMTMALQTINQQSNVINQLMAQLKGE